MKDLDPELARKAVAGTLSKAEQDEVSRYALDLTELITGLRKSVHESDQDLVFPWRGQAAHKLSPEERRARRVKNKAKRHERAQKSGVALGAAIAQTRRRRCRRHGLKVGKMINYLDNEELKMATGVMLVGKEVWFKV